MAKSLSCRGTRLPTDAKHQIIMKPQTSVSFPSSLIRCCKLPMIGKATSSGPFLVSDIRPLKVGIVELLLIESARVLLRFAFAVIESFISIKSHRYCYLLLFHQLGFSSGHPSLCYTNHNTYWRIRELTTGPDLLTVSSPMREVSTHPF